MILPFFKYHGAGNDFIMIDNTRQVFRKSVQSEKLISHLCHRRFGIGADGLILIENSRKADFEMIYFNADGRPGSMCGNGGRCSVAFARMLKLAKNKISFITSDGIHHAEIISQNNFKTSVKLQMQDVKNFMREKNYFIIDTGSPHYVMFTKNVKDMDVFRKGSNIRYSAAFRKKGINVNFAEYQKGKIFVRTYERGVEDETLSCGTGATATAIAANELGMVKGNSCALITLGGDLKVHFIKTGRNTYTDIWLEGPAECSFEGEVEI